MITDNIRMTYRDWKNLRERFRRSFTSSQSLETGALGLVSESATDRGREYLLAKILWPRQGDLKIATHGAITFSSQYLRRAHMAMRKEGLSGLAVFHTHPMSDQTVSFSHYDDAEEPLLVRNIQEIEPATRIVSIVLGKTALCGRVWDESDSPHSLGCLTVVGERLLNFPLCGMAESEAARASDIFDYSATKSGRGGSGRLAELRIVVVGAGGTGSIMCELLARAGCRQLVVIDHDVVKDKNLNRILYSTTADAASGVSKVSVLKRGIEGLGLGVQLEAIEASVLDRAILKKLRDADVVFGCVDRALPRKLLCEMSQQYYLPYIDVGAEIGGDDSGLICVTARVNYVAPDRPCLCCTGLVTPRELRFESVSFEERRRIIDQGYSDDLAMKQPAVMDLNMRAASMGLMVLRHLLQPFLLELLPVTILENIITYRQMAIGSARSHDPACQICQQNDGAGYGECGPVLGFEPEVVEAITDPIA